MTLYEELSKNMRSKAWEGLHDLFVDLGWWDDFFKLSEEQGQDIDWLSYVKARIAQNHLAMLLTERRQEEKKVPQQSGRDSAAGWTVTIRGNGDLNVVSN